MARKSCFIFLMAVVFLSLSAQEIVYKGFSLTEDELHRYEANPKAKNDKEKTDAQLMVDEAKRLGSNHIILTPRAIMIGGDSNEVIPLTENKDRVRERTGYVNLMNYIHAQGLSVGIRPIFFVVLDKQSMKFDPKRWHGNITPKDPNRWFESFQNYLKSYALYGKLGKADSFTIGAELYSMTVGIEDYWKEYPHGFPKHWLNLLKFLKTQLGATTKLMYDINFTDDSVSSAGGLKTGGGELARWRYRLVDLAPQVLDREDPSNVKNQSWFDLVDFWNSLDYIGIDMYRSLASWDDLLGEDIDSLSAQLKVRSDNYATELDTIMMDISTAPTVESKNVVFKEVGYRSSLKGFIEPFAYDKASDEVNMLHQAAAYKAYFESFFEPGFPWMAGVIFWDMATNPLRKGLADPGFTPAGKPMTEEIISNYFHR